MRLLGFDESKLKTRQEGDETWVFFPPGIFGARAKNPLLASTTLAADASFFLIFNQETGLLRESYTIRHGAHGSLSTVAGSSLSALKNALNRDGRERLKAERELEKQFGIAKLKTGKTPVFSIEQDGTQIDLAYNASGRKKPSLVLRLITFEEDNPWGFPHSVRPTSHR